MLNGTIRFFLENKYVTLLPVIFIGSGIVTAPLDKEAFLSNERLTDPAMGAVRLSVSTGGGGAECAAFKTVIKLI